MPSDFLPLRPRSNSIRNFWRTARSTRPPSRAACAPAPSTGPASGGWCTVSPNDGSKPLPAVTPRIRRSICPAAPCLPPDSGRWTLSGRFWKTRRPPFTPVRGADYALPKRPLSLQRSWNVMRRPLPKGRGRSRNRRVLLLRPDTARRGCHASREDQGASPKLRRMRAATRRDHLLGRADAGVPATVRGREVVHRASFACKEQAVVDRRGELRPVIGKTRRRERIRTERERIGAPSVHSDGPDARREGAAKKVDKLGHGAIEKRGLAAGFHLRRKAPAEIDLDHRPPKRTELIDRGRRAIGASEDAGGMGELLGALQRHKQFVGKPERQTVRGFGFVRQCRREQDPFCRDERARDGDDYLIGGDHAFGGLDAQALAAMIDGAHRAIELRCQRLAAGADERAITLGHAPVHARIVIA